MRVMKTLTFTRPADSVRFSWLFAAWTSFPNLSQDKFLPHRRLTFMMLDADIVAVRPATVCGAEWGGTAAEWNGKPSKNGTGFDQPQQPHQHWHIDVSCLDVCATFYHLCLRCSGWSSPAFSTRRVDFLSIRWGIRDCRDICGLSNRSSSLRDSLLASFLSGVIIALSPNLSHVSTLHHAPRSSWGGDAFSRP
jgi:hypothetical protein